ncbi:MAG: hypothetical protein EFT35_08825 [Methanophagales archaeon ANME-1-THS]|nr:MAG: hypothetical protein EFT35_08825 [Methanophagales archaeon ANME-1-THS]
MELVDALTQKLNGTATLLCFPHYPSKLGVSAELQKKFEPRTTLAILKVIGNYVELSANGPFLIIIDLEHFSTRIVNDLRKQIEQGQVGFSIKGEIKKLDPPDERTLLITGQNGKDFSIVVCVMGDETCPKTEFHIAHLIEVKYGVRIDPPKQDKDKIKFLKKVKKITGAKNYGKLVDNLSEEDLITFFPQLMQALRAIDELVKL